MDETLERVEAHDDPSRPSGRDANHAARQIEGDEHQEGAEDRDGADPAERHLMEMAPIAPGRLFERVGFGVGNAAAALDRLELLQELLFADRAFRRVDRTRLLRGSGRRRQRQRD